MKFRSKMNNRRIVQGLFLEMARVDDMGHVLYTLKDEDAVVEGRTIPSLKKLYFKMRDITEYDFALTYFENWDHWLQICQAPWFKPLITVWREELEVEMRAQALKNIIAEANSDSRNAFTANKYLLDKGWVRDAYGQPKRGRPSKEAIQEKTGLDRKVFEDFERLLGSEPQGRQRVLGKGASQQ